MIEAWTQWEGHVVNGAFQLQKYLGGSSQSAVFLSERRGPAPKQATIKLIPANAASNDLYLSRWSLAEGLSHPHLIRLMEKGPCRLGGWDLLYVVMEYAEENLAEILPERALSPGEVHDLLEPTLKALSYLHGRGLAHGHLKPANVLAAKDQLKLTSDGLCALGKPSPLPEKLSAYDPPERASGVASPAADVWSLGITLAETLTQRVPVRNEKEGQDPVVPKDLPAPLFEIVRGCLRCDPERRMTIAEIAARLHPSPTLQSKRPTPPAPPAKMPQLGLPKRSLVAPALIAVLTVAVLFGGLGLIRRQPDVRAGSAAKPATTQTDAKPPERSVPAPVQQGAATNSNLAVASRIKPSPVPGRREVPAATISRTPADQVTTIDHPVLNGEILREVLPDVPQTARDTIQGTIRVGVKVQVDPSGNVVGTELDFPGPSKYFARLATEAAQSWKFAPASPEMSRQFIVRFDFRNTETRASAARTP